MRIVIDPNVRVENNWTFAGFEDILGAVDDLEIGDHATVMCEETDLIGDATVARIDPGARLVYLAVDWSSMRKDDGPSEINTTAAQFDSMWARGIPVDTAPGSRTFASGVVTQLKCGYLP